MINLEPKTKDEIVDLIRRGVKVILPPNIPIESACLFHAEATRQILQTIIDSDKLRKAGQPKSRVLLQAGTCSWQYRRTDLDDGVVSTHFTYEWQGQSLFAASLEALNRGRLPEMHVWNAIMTPGHPPQIVDVTTRYLRENCKKIINEEWTAPIPPDYLWCYGGEVPPTTLYHPNQEATKLAYLLLNQSVDVTILK